MSEEALNMAEKRREIKGKGGKERYTHLNAEFQRIGRRDKKAFLSDQCKETEEWERLLQDIFKKIRDSHSNKPFEYFQNRTQVVPRIRPSGIIRLRK